MDVHEDKSTFDKVSKFDLAIKEKKDKITTVKLKNEMQINEQKMKLQPNMPLEVREQMEVI